MIAGDGAILRGTLLRPESATGREAILRHGVASSRYGMLGHARYLLEAAYICLLSDSRGHGISGGELVTYGVREAADVARWAEFLERQEGVTRLYGLGGSMGAAVLLQSIVPETRFRAVVAECSFDSFRHVAVQRLEQFTGVSAGPLFVAPVEAGLLYARLRYGVDLGSASPAESLRRTNVPVLFVYGSTDRNIPPVHSERLMRVRPSASRLWIVQGGHHVDALSMEPTRFPKAVLEWFAEHD